MAHAAHNDIRSITPPPRATRRDWIGLAVLMLPTLLIVMDLTVLHLAVPHISEELKPSSAQLLWIVDIYGFMIAGSLITMGTLGDRIGRRKLLLIGAAAFGVASILAAFSTSASMLIATRALLGIAGATLMPSTLSLIRNMFLDPRQRTTAIGIWVSGFSVGSALGPLVGGALLEHFWWGSVFLVGVPVMVILLIAGPLLLPEYKDPKPGRFDLLSALLSLMAVLLTIYGLKHVAETGVDLTALVTIVAGLATGVIFIQRQRILADPLLDLRLFRIPAFSASLATYTVGVFVAFGTTFFMAQYLQLVLGLQTMEAGLWSLPGALVSIVGSNIAPQLVRRIRPAYVIAGGLLLAALGAGVIALVNTDSLALVVVGNVLMSFGFGMTFALTADLVVGSAPPERAGAASAISETGAEFGGAMGIAILGSIGMAVYRSQIAGNLPAGIPTDVLQEAQETLGGAFSAVERLSNDLGGTLLSVAQGAFVNGFQLVALIGSIAFVMLAVLVAVLLRHIEKHTGEAHDPHSAPIEVSSTQHTAVYEPVPAFAEPEAMPGD